MAWVGKRTRAWERIRRIIKPRFESAGITQCEFSLPGCWRDNGLSFAHYDKRRFLSEDQLYVCALACANCHSLLEVLPRAEMRRRVMKKIAARACQGLDKP